MGVCAFVTLAALTSILGACGSRTSVVKNMDLNALMEEAEKKAYLVNQFRAEFVKTRSNSVFNREMKAKGVLVFQKPDKFQLSISGDVSLEVLSNGRIVTVTHDNKDRDVYHVHGERDQAKMADPLMLLIENLGNGGLRRFAVLHSVQVGDTLIAQIDPSNHKNFARVENATLAIDDSGQLKKVSISFKNGDLDETEFLSWNLLAQNDPDILALNSKLDRIKDRETVEEASVGAIDHSSLADAADRSKQ
jgi:hypothetical protein